MKSSVWVVIFFILFSFITVLFFPGEPLPGQAVGMYGTMSDDWGACIANSPDGGFLLCGETSSMEQAGDNDILLIRVNKKGKILWQKRLGGDGHDAAFAVIGVSGGYIVVGHTQSVSPFWISSWILKVDDYGNIIWQKAVGNAPARNICKTGDGNFFVMGNGRWNSLGREFPWLMKMTPDGEMIWEKVLNEGWTGYWKGGFTAAAALEDYGCIAVMDERLCRFDKKGNLLWIKTFDRKVGIISSIAAVSNDRFLIATGLWPLGIPAGMMLLSGDGDVIWAKTSDSFMFSQILPCPDGTYRILGEDDVGSVVTFVINENGEMTESALRYLFPDYYDIVSNPYDYDYGTIAPDGNLAFCAEAFLEEYHGKNREMVFVKTGMLNRISGNCTDTEEFALPLNDEPISTIPLSQVSLDWRQPLIDTSTYDLVKPGDAMEVNTFCPVIKEVNILHDPFRLEIIGDNFLGGCYVYIDGICVPETRYKSPYRIIAKEGDALKSMLPKGVTVCLEIHGYKPGDLYQSTCYYFKR